MPAANTAVRIACPQIVLEQRPALSQMRLQAVGQRLRQHCYAILRALPVAHDDLPLRKLHILNTQPHAFHQAHAGAKQQTGHQLARMQLAVKQGEPAHRLHVLRLRADAAMLGANLVTHLIEQLGTMLYGGA